MEKLIEIKQIEEGDVISSPSPEGDNLFVEIIDINHDRMLLESDFSQEKRWFDYNEIKEKLFGYTLVKRKA